MGEFSWEVSGSFAAYAYLAGFKLDEPYHSAQACAEVFRIGRRKTAEIFGPEISLGSPGCPPISYGHIICLGAPVSFPEDSEPGVRPIYDNIKEGIAALQKSIDFGQNTLFQRYWQIYQHLKQKFPEEKFGFGGFGLEGPITTAVLLRGQDFYLDLYDSPEEAKKFLALITESVLEFIRFLRKINNEPQIAPEGTGLADDFTSLISPELWPDFVVPFWNKYYAGLTTGKRSIHVENLKPGHLKYLKEVGISFYDPSVSLQLTPKIIKKETAVPFCWRLASFELAGRDNQKIKDWVHRSIAEGANRLFTIIEKINCLGENPKKIGVFIKTCQELESAPKKERGK